MLGFWIYLMSDCLIFAMLFAAYGVLGGSYAAGPSPKDLFDLPLVAVNTSALLLSSITYGFAMLAMEKNQVKTMQIWLVITGLFGLVHGCGFADVLRAVGLPRDHLVGALFGFNLGVEAGQLLVVLPLVPLLRWLWRQDFGLRVTRGLSSVICAAGLGLAVMRVAGLG